MKTAPFFVFGFGALALYACDDSKTAASVEASTSASVATVASVAPSSNPLPAPTKKKEWKCASTATAVDFAGDTALEKEVRLKLNKPEGLISPADLANVKSINLTKYGPVNELNPCVMPKFSNLHDLFIGGGDLDDLSPIADLITMMSLRATENKLKNIEPLKKLVHMDRLDLSHTQVDNIDVVAGMADLTEIELDGTAVTDLKPLSGLTKLEKVTIANTAIKDVSPLKNSAKTLKLLDMSGSLASDYSMLASPKLKVKM